MADEWEQDDAAPASDDDETGEGRPAWLDKGPPRAAPAQTAAKDEWDEDDAAPAPVSPALPRRFPDAKGESDALAADLAASQARSRRGLLERAKETAAGMRDTAVGGARAVGTAVMHPLDTIQDPARRREFERGLSDMITLGYAEKAGKAAERYFSAPDSEGDSWGTKIDKRAARALGLANPDDGLAANEVSDREQAGDFRSLGRIVGMAAPGAGSVIAKGASRVVAPVFEGAQAATRAGAAALGAGNGVAGNAIAAPVTAALSANAAGDRAGAALDALTDPVGLAMSAAGGAVAEPVAKNLVGNAKSRATKDIANDIVAAEGPKARVTDQKKIAEVNDRIFDMTKEHPELRQIWREPAEKALPKIAQVKDRIAEPLDAFYDAVDQKTGGGIRLGDIVDGYRNKAKELRKTRQGIEDADRLDRLADQELVAARARQGAQFDPKAPINAEGTTAGQQLEMLEKSATRALAKGQNDVVQQLQGEADRIREMASKDGHVNLDERIPTKDFRANVTALHNTADSVMGGLEGTPRYEALSRLYDEGKAIIDKHLDSSGVDPKALAETRKINNEYFLLSRAEKAIESRGWKEANRESGHLIKHGVDQAVKAGPTAMAIAGAMHPHLILPLAATYGAVKAGPAIANRVNWKLANLDPAAAAGAVERIAPRLGGEIGARAGAGAADQHHDRALAQLIDGASAGGDADALRARAAAEGVDQATIEAVLRKFAQQQQVAP